MSHCPVRVQPRSALQQRAVGAGELAKDRHDLGFEGIDRRLTFLVVEIAEVDDDDQVATMADARLLLAVLADLCQRVDPDEEPIARSSGHTFQVE